MKILSGAAIFNKDGKVLLVQQKKDGPQSLLWGLPGGHANDGESPADAAVREVKEETSLNIKLTNLVSVQILEVYDGSEYLLVTYKAKAQNLPDIEIDKSEVNDYGWFSLEDIKREKIKLRGSFLLPPVLKAFSGDFSDAESLFVSYYTREEAGPGSV